MVEFERLLTDSNGNPLHVLINPTRIVAVIQSNCYSDAGGGDCDSVIIKMDGGGRGVIVRGTYAEVLAKLQSADVFPPNTRYASETPRLRASRAAYDEAGDVLDD